MAYNHDLQGWRHFIQSTPCKPSNALTLTALPSPKCSNIWGFSLYRSQIGVPSLVRSKRKNNTRKTYTVQTACRAVGRRFRIYTKAKLPFSAYVYLYNIPKGKKIGKYLACPVYIFNAFFSFWGDLGALLVLFLLVTGHHLGTYPRWYRNALAR